MNSTTKIIAAVAVFALLFAAVGYAADTYRGSTSSTVNTVDSKYVVVKLGDDSTYEGDFVFTEKLKFDTQYGVDGPTYYLPFAANTVTSEPVEVFIDPNVLGDSYTIDATASNVSVDGIFSGTLTVEIFTDEACETLLQGAFTPSEDNKSVYLKVSGVQLTSATAYATEVPDGFDPDGSVSFTVTITAVDA